MAIVTAVANENDSVWDHQRLLNRRQRRRWYLQNPVWRAGNSAIPCKKQIGWWFRFGEQSVEMIGEEVAVVTCKTAMYPVDVCLHRISPPEEFANNPHIVRSVFYIGSFI